MKSCLTLDSDGHHDGPPHGLDGDLSLISVIRHKVGHKGSDAGLVVSMEVEDQVLVILGGELATR
jgi:hypothetical protein